MNSQETCPRCEGPLPRDPVASIWDSLTFVCAACSKEERAHDMAWGGVPNFAYVLVGGNKYLKSESTTGKELE